MKKRIAVTVLSSLLTLGFFAISSQPAQARHNNWNYSNPYALYQQEVNYMNKVGMPNPWTGSYGGYYGGYPYGSYGAYPYGSYGGYPYSTGGVGVYPFF